MKLTDLFEAKFNADKATFAMGKMVSYIERKLGEKLFKVPGVEQFKNSKESGFGHRYAIGSTTKMLRFNWAGASNAGRTNEIISIDIFAGKRNPSFSVTTQNISMVKTLPALVAILMSPTLGKIRVFPVNAAEAITESAYVVEAKRDDFTAESALTDFLEQLKRGKALTRSDFIGQYHIVHAGIFDTIFNDFADEFEIKGRRISLGGNTKVDALKNEILSKAGVLVVSSGGGGETYFQSKEEQAAEESSNDRIGYTDSLDHLEGLVQGIVKGAFNALFVAGKGGTGKTQTVEKVLSKHGLTDGEGYFKNTGSASAAGIFTLFWKHREDIILFDDSDGALADQDARNLIKSATDTKRKRKLVWNKKSSFIYDPEGEDADELADDPDMAPKYFDFEGRVIFISNLPLNKLDPDGALRTRAFVITIDPTDEEMFDYMEKILFNIRLEEGLALTTAERYHVLKIVKSSKSKSEVSLRKLVRALNLAASGSPNWEKLVELYS